VRDFLIKLTFASQWRQHSGKVGFQESLWVTSERKVMTCKKTLRRMQRQGFPPRNANKRERPQTRAPTTGNDKWILFNCLSSFHMQKQKR